MTSNNIKDICKRLSADLSILNKDYNTLLSALENTDQISEIENFIKSLKSLQNALDQKKEDSNFLIECFKTINYPTLFKSELNSFFNSLQSFLIKT
jgi:hypothetical protein